MRLLALGAIAAAIAAAPVPAADSPPLTAETSFDRDWIYFGDTITARVDVLADRRQVDAGSIRLGASFQPWQQLDQARSSLGESGAVAHRTWSFTLVCLAVTCLPRG